ncbi:hypothetical protein NOCA2500025 [metagenome]|uniref:Uncharacterized protein n=1 Tax=metagenome TaxID=256318 RepID=A0A2P2C958_9ZZZZ
MHAGETPTVSRMSDLGIPRAQQRLDEPPDEPEIPFRVLAIAVALMLVLAGITGYVLTRDDAAEAGPSYPSTWDARIAPSVKKTERLRGLMFLHPVAVRFLPAAQFERTMRADREELSDEDLADLEDTTALLRAVGLLQGDVDLFDTVNDLQTGGTLAYYSFEDQTITIRGRTLSPSVRSTVVHELTHALQDQHFSIGERMQELAAAEDDGHPASEILDSLIEGDAERVQTRYRESLTTKQRAALDADTKKEGDRAAQRLQGIPKVLLTMFTSSYTFGQALVQLADADGGNRAVDDLFRRPPTHELALLDPFTVLAHDNDAVQVDVPALRAGEKEVSSGEFGVMTWYFVLAERMPLADALAAAEGWGGDSSLDYEDADGTVCTRATVVGASPKDTRRLYAALRRWVAAAPGAPATVARAGARIRFQSCDPGRKAHVGKNVSAQAVTLALTRTYTGIGLMQGGVEADVSRCVAGRLVHAYPLSALNDSGYAATHPGFVPRLRAMVGACRTALG